MIISIEGIYYLLTGRPNIDHQLFIDWVKLKGDEKVLDSTRKNLSNYFSKKHRTSETTKIIINDKLSKLLMPSGDKFDFLEPVDVSTPELALEHMESGYKNIFREGGWENSLLAKEVAKTFTCLRKAQQMNAEGMLTEEACYEIFQGGLFSKIDYANCLSLETPHFKCHLDLLLYFFACLDVDSAEGQPYLQMFFDALNSDSEKTNFEGGFRPPFAYYLEILKEDLKLRGEGFTEEDVAKKFGNDVRTVYFNKSGGRGLTWETKKWLLANGHLLYFMIVFWMNLINEFTADTKIMSSIMAKISEYPKVRKIAQCELDKLAETEPN